MKISKQISAGYPFTTNADQNEIHFTLNQNTTTSLKVSISMMFSKYRLLSLISTALSSALLLSNASEAGTVTFGSGVNEFQMEFVTIGNPGNAPDSAGTPNPAGSVGYTYSIGKFEVSEEMISKFNALQSLQITKDSRGDNKPATSVSWNEAARFVNWLNSSTGRHAAYKFSTDGVNDNLTPWTSADHLDYDPNNAYRSKRSTFVLPSYNEWYKAAFYDEVTSTYHQFATNSNTIPTAIVSGTDVGTAVYGNEFALGPADIHLAGGLSAYGVMGLSGNVWEWEEDSGDLSNNDGASFRGVRGGAWYVDANMISSRSRRHDFDSPSGLNDNIGFRVVQLHLPASPVPEPTSIVCFGLISIAAFYRARPIVVNRREFLSRSSLEIH